MVRTTTKRIRRSSGRDTQSRGVAAVEMAVVAPVLVALLLGILEFGWVMSANQTLTNAAREGARLASLDGVTDDMVRERVKASMTMLNVTEEDYQVNITHGTEEDNPSVTVQIVVPYENVSIVGVGSFVGLEDKQLTSTCVMLEERE